MQAFEACEYRERLNNVRTLMSEARLDALVVLSESNLCYLTGYEAFSTYTPQAALVTLDDDPYLIERQVDLQNNPGLVWLPESHQHGYSETSVGSRAHGSPWTSIGDFIKGKVTPSARIGVEYAPEGMVPNTFGVLAHRHLAEALGERELLDASGLIAQCKRVKSDRELEHMMDAAAIADQAMLAGISKIAVGTRQADVFATVTSALISGTESTPGGAMNTTPWMHVGPVGGFATAPHLKWSDAVYEAGQQTNLELGAWRHRYASCLARTIFLGTPSPRLKEISKGVIEAWHAAFDAIRPGALCSDVARTVGALLEPYGIRKDTRCGYSVGLDWIDGGASLALNDDTEIVPNMTFHLLLGVWNPNEGYNFSETVRGTADGAATLSSNVPRELFEIPA